MIIYWFCKQVNDVSLSEATCEDALSALQYPNPFIHLTVIRDHSSEPLAEGNEGYVRTQEFVGLMNSYPQLSIYMQLVSCHTLNKYNLF